jgi:ureidoglycolate hydrolase
MGIVKVEFKKDFATKKKGDICEYDSQFASRLINEGVAKKYVKKAPAKAKKEE